MNPLTAGALTMPDTTGNASPISLPRKWWAGIAGVVLALVVLAGFGTHLIDGSGGTSTTHTTPAARSAVKTVGQQTAAQVLSVFAADASQGDREGTLQQLCSTPAQISNTTDTSALGWGWTFMTLKEHVVTGPPSNFRGQTGATLTVTAQDGSKLGTWAATVRQQHGRWCISTVN